MSTIIIYVTVFYREKGIISGMKLENVSNSQMIKEINQQKVLRLIFTEGPIARVEIARKTGLTQQTITNIVNRLLKKNIIFESNAILSGTKRRPIPLEINSSNLYCIGIELAVTYVRGTLMDFQNNILKEVTEVVPRYEHEQHPMQFIYKVIDHLLQYVPDLNGLKGIGFSIQGLVDSENGVVIYSPGLRWKNFHLRDILQGEYGFPIFLENDANLLALVESLNGQLADSKQSITYKFDYGIGSAMVLQRQLLHGANFVAGEFGHYKAFSGEYAIKCHCGAEGCLTTLASISGLRRYGVDFDEFESKVRQNDSEALKLFQTICSAMGLAVANSITLLNPEHIMFTGKVIDRMEDILMPILEREIKKLVPESCADVKILKLSQTPDESGSAAGLVMNHFFDVPFDKFY
ncbi:ROK family transcriptional regulator [Bacillus niameyensis]|uniref:ROK family transcriptional regulator n=1 Tax=Bacillus niameyensis TaxID=1522308 RepID=UPI000783A2BB|nr:ROK family transcriptional regulator [Bacillus niameyensis]